MVLVNRVVLFHFFVHVVFNKLVQFDEQQFFLVNLVVGQFIEFLG